ncbi:uncharacterized protein DNG_09054 [Cephalotrichum gorgonifer]|uniref:Uncharacterized protein n=1 Tax=Cephalotrichum gorgonifer TaxID=2041049 RepID=A0AAE8N4Y4_9PEZI|nr:uncharacterized protein DNG_09054 [Cephalotrichum gorgonifer]
MRASVVQAILALSSVAGAVRVLGPASGLQRRQAFDPDEETLPAEFCTDFGPTYIECVPESGSEAKLCIDPAAGESCCDNKWGCPAASFCLIQDLCCPDGLDPATCAEQNNVTLPPDFGETPLPTAGPKPTESPTAPPTEEPSDLPPSEEEPTEPPFEQAAGTHNTVGVMGAILGLAAFVIYHYNIKCRLWRGRVWPVDTFCILAVSE